MPVYDFGQEEGRYYIAMGYMPGGSLKELIKREGPLSKERALEILEQVGAGLSYLHRKGVIHRDLKPGNILFDDEGQARVSDMGFAKLARGTSAMEMTEAGGLIGTLAYMAPEIWDGQSATTATDVYSLACVLVEMLTGEVLFDGSSTPMVMKKHFEPLKLPQNLPEEWRPAIEKALEKESASRFENVHDFVNALRAMDEKPSIPVVGKQHQGPADFRERTTDEAESLPTPVEASQQSQQAKEPTRHDQVENEKGHDGVPALIKPKAPKGKVPVYVGLGVLALLVVFLLIRAGIFVGPQKDTGLPPAEVTTQPTATMTPTPISLLGSTVISSSNTDQVKQLLTLEGHKSSVYSVAWSPDGKTLASGSFDGTIRLWGIP